MPHPRGAIWAERLLLAFILVAIGGTLNLIVTVHRHASISSPIDEPIANVDQAIPSAPEAPQPHIASSREADAISREISVNPKIAISPNSPEPSSFPTAEELTKKAAARLSASMATEIAARESADRRAHQLEAARKSAIAESQRWKRRELLVRQQIDGLSKRADQLEDAASALDADRDVLARERDALKAALAKASRRSGYAVLPYKGPNGTWRRPIVLECANGGIILQPSGQTFSGLELSPRIHPRSSLIVRAVAREMLHIRAAETPDGAPAVPYLVFLVRPNGVRPYYESRSSLEPLGIAFGYELIDQDLVVDIPDLDNLATWDGSVPLDVPLETAPPSRRALAKNDASSRDRARSSAGPGSFAQGDGNSQSGSDRVLADRASPSGGPARGGSESNNITPEDFVWPSGPRTTDEPATSGPGAAGPATGGGSFSGSIGGLVSAQPGSRTRDPRTGGQGVGTETGLDSAAGGGLGMGNSRSGVDAFAPSVGGGAGMGRSVGPLAVENGNGGGGGPGTAANLAPGSASGTGNAPSRTRPLATMGGAGVGLGGDGRAVALGNDAGATPDPKRAGNDDGAMPGLQGAGSGSGVASHESSAQGATSTGRSAEFTLPDLEPAGTLKSATNSGSPDVASQPGSQGTPSSTLPPLPASDWPPSIPSAPNDGGSLPPAGTTGLAPAPSLGQTAQGPYQPANSSATQTQSSASGNPPLSSSLSQPFAASDGGSPPSSSSSSTSDTNSTSRSSSTSTPSSSSRSSLGSSSGASSDLSSSSSLSSSSGLNASSSFSSNATSQIASAASGLPLGSTSSTTQSTQGSPSLSFGQDSSSKPDSSDEFSPPHIVLPERPPGSIDVAFEIVVVCREHDVLLHPGGYIVTAQRLREPRGNQESLLARELRAMVRKRAIVDPLIRPRPSIKFLVETNGDDTFWLARRQMLFALPDWPVSLQVSGSHDVRVFDTGKW